MPIHGDENVYRRIDAYGNVVKANSVYIPANLSDQVKRNIVSNVNIVTGDMLNAVGFRAVEGDALHYQVDTLNNPDVFYTGYVEGTPPDYTTQNRDGSYRRGYRNFIDAVENTNFDAVFDLWYQTAFRL